ncbi:MAG: hypothetical protein ACRD0A_14925 [Acidimicrobiales bacterium]
MAAPEYVPVKPIDDVRAYESPPRRPQPWLSDRPGDLDAGQPKGGTLGWPGPDQGYALALARLLRDRLRLAEREHHDDVVEGGVGIALKRASLLGRAPVIHDLVIAFTIWGFLDESPPDELVELRRAAFDELSLPLHYREQRRLVASVPDEVLYLPPAEVEEAYRRDWRGQIDVGSLGPPRPST